MVKAFSLVGWEMPSSPSTITGIILSQVKIVAEKNKNEISRLQANGTRFSVIFDEWTSLSNKRYMGVILRSKTQKFNLGMGEINGAASSSNLLAILVRILSKHVTWN